MRRGLVSVVVGLAALGVAAPAFGATDTLKAGVGRADIQPPTGIYFFGWVRSDSKSHGQHTRLQARSIVLQRGGRKLALVSVDLGAVPNGLIVAAAKRVADLGIKPEDVIVSASHTHSGPSGFFNYSAFNTVAPSKDNPSGFEVGTAADPQLYSFLSRQLAAAIRRADADLAPAALAWGSTQLLGVTDNRSIEAHLANFGILLDPGQGKPEMDPGGYANTIDPNVDVLRVDKVLRRGRTRPIGMWPVFADHGTVNRPTFQFYNADHHGAAERVSEAAIRKLGKVPASQDVVSAYGNSDEGDMTAGLSRAGPAAAEWVGRAEARAFMRAWRTAGKELDRTPDLDWRWTRFCYCGQETEGGLVDKRGVSGAPFFTGSEENRGPLYDVDGVSHEGQHLPASTGPQGDKIPAYTDVAGAMPNALPLTTARIGDHVVATIPGEMTVELGRRVRAAVTKSVDGVGVKGVVLAGLANDFIQYLTTPEEYDRQHYEGGSQLYGRVAGNMVMQQLAGLAGLMAQGKPAPEAYPFDPENGIPGDAEPFPAGAEKGVVVAQPKATRRLEHAVFKWQGGERGMDRPVDRAFAAIERRVGKRWVRATDDLGIQIMWAVDDSGGYTARWEPSRWMPLGTYRFAVDANRYKLASEPFRLSYSTALTAAVTDIHGGKASIELEYPNAAYQDDFTYRPRVAGRFVRKTGSTVVAGALRDRWGNRNGLKLIAAG
jgi:neutral ceramidase